MKRSRTKTVAMAVAVLAMAGPAIASTASAGVTPSVSPSPRIFDDDGHGWQPCFEEQAAEFDVVFECKHVDVPLDYDRPRRGTIEVELTRIPASDPDARRGSILFNPGGPGGSGIDFIVGFGPFVGFALSPEIPQQFDLIGFDPRGISRSTPIRCFSTLDEAVEVFPPFPFPEDRSEVRTVRRGDRRLAHACRHDYDARRIGRHMSTANVARDMDQIRQSVGDEQLNFLGLSYGTFIGATYANLFPDRVGSIVVDGVLDPVAWVNEEAEVPFSTRLRSDEGAAETLNEFFRQCDAAAPGNCALAPDSEARFDALAASLKEAPRTVVDPETGESFDVTYRDVIGFSLGVLYNPFGYAFLAEIYALLESSPPAGTPTFAPISGLMDGFHPDGPDEPYENFVEGFPAVACVDTNNPRSYRTWERAGEAAEAEFGHFGKIWTWASSPCAQWPFKDRDRYEGPFTAVTSNPVLVIGNLYDPATRYEGAQTVRSLLPNSALLTVDTPGHTSLGLNECAGFVTAQYLLDPSFAGVIDGETCPAEFNAFDVVAGPPDAPTSTSEADPDARRTAPTIDTDADTRAEIREVLDEIVGLVP